MSEYEELERLQQELERIKAHNKIVVGALLDHIAAIGEELQGISVPLGSEPEDIMMRNQMLARENELLHRQNHILTNLTEYFKRTADRWETRYTEATRTEN